MLDTLVEKNPALLIPLVSVLGATAVFLVWIIAHYWARVRRMDVEAGLKREMLNRGLAPAEIERVLLASADHGTEEPPAEKESISDNEYYLVEKMLDEEYPVEEIEKLIRAFKSGEKSPVRSIEHVMTDRS